MRVLIIEHELKQIVCVQNSSCLFICEYRVVSTSISVHRLRHVKYSEYMLELHSFLYTQEVMICFHFTTGQPYTFVSANV